MSLQDEMGPWVSGSGGGILSHIREVYGFIPAKKIWSLMYSVWGDVWAAAILSAYILYSIYTDIDKLAGY